MSWRSKEKPSFFKVLSNMDFRKLLRMPPHFLRKYELTLPANVKLRVDDSGRRWNVRVERMDDGLFCFTNGWGKFAEDAALKLGEFLVFSVVAKSELNVVIYETSCWKREIPPVELNAYGLYVRKGANDVATSERNENSKESNPLYFKIHLRAFHKSRIMLPKPFSKAAKMKARKRVRLEYEGRHGGGGCFAAALRPQKTGRVDLGKGWYDFRVANGLRYDRVYSFEMKSDDDQVIHVKRLN
ncbi:B3 domain-containing protein REM-like 1 [Salvia miltiorrhiza]|uniref:B3 domain-containing protein REM-like 1 n=1 Tax=Salvia miltiorrhiza TaxID=226208 RepID=UPI0025ACCB26|nr:B3 domain-containing protein REM-like 1 [Salvia miltiorrhiza]